MEEWEHYLTCGLVSSPNLCLLVTLQYVSAFYDHLILRELGWLVARTLHPREGVAEALATGALGQGLRGREDLPTTLALAPSPAQIDFFFKCS